jgi:hypothetical protein
MVTNWVYWRRVSGASKRIFVTIKSTIDAVKFQIQYSFHHFNVMMCRIDIHTSYMYISVLLTRWQSYLHSNVMMCRIDIHTSYMYISVLLTRWQSYLHSNVMMCRIDIHTSYIYIFQYYCQDDKAVKISCYMYFNRGISENYTIKSTIDAVKYSNTIQLSPFKCNHVFFSRCCSRLMFWRKAGGRVYVSLSSLTR